MFLFVSDVEVYGETEKGSSLTCMDNLYKLTIKSRRRKIEITPTYVKMNRKRVSVKDRDLIRFRYKKFFQVTVFFNREDQKKTISVRFTVRDHLRNAKGFYGKVFNFNGCTCDFLLIVIRNELRESSSNPRAIDVFWWQIGIWNLWKNISLSVLTYLKIYGEIENDNL